LQELREWKLQMPLRLEGDGAQRIQELKNELHACRQEKQQLEADLKEARSTRISKNDLAQLAEIEKRVDRLLKLVGLEADKKTSICNKLERVELWLKEVCKELKK